MPSTRMTRPDAHGSRTMTIQSTPSAEGDDAAAAHGDREVGVLRLRGESTRPRSGATTEASSSRERRVVWTDDTVDNEGLGKKKSKSTLSA